MELRLNLTDDERELLAALLERERSELHADVRRSTRSLDAHEQLRARLALVERLRARLSPVDEPVRR